jgi:hypothetical protein
MENFDPSKLIQPLAVNPRGTSKPVLTWDIRITTKTLKVDVTGIFEKFGLETAGLNFAGYPDGRLLIWKCDSKENAMTVKGASTEYKMASFVELARVGGLVGDNDKIVYLTLGEMQTANGVDYHTLVLDPKNPTVLNADISDAEEEPQSEIDLGEPVENEIEEAVSAE